MYNYIILVHIPTLNAIWVNISICLLFSIENTTKERLGCSEVLSVETIANKLHRQLIENVVKQNSRLPHTTLANKWLFKCIFHQQLHFMHSPFQRFRSCELGERSMSGRESEYMPLSAIKSTKIKQKKEVEHQTMKSNIEEKIKN